MRVRWLMAVSLLTSGCGGSGGEPSSIAPQNPPTNSAPSISGSPPTIVSAGALYAFTPTASDPDGDTLTFTIVSQPSWASFDSSTGSLSGTPGTIDVGTFPAVTISVSDGSESVSLPPFDIAVDAVQLGTALLTWDAPTTNADGSQLVDLDGYRIHYGQVSGSYTRTDNIDDALAVSHTVTGLDVGTWYFVVAAVDASGNESAYSTEVSKAIAP